MLGNSRLMRLTGLAGTLAALVLASPRAAQAQTWIGALLGSNEVPAVSTPASGFVTITLNNRMLSLVMNWSGLTGGNPTAGHIHCCVAPGSNVGVAVNFLNFPATASGSYSNTFDLTSTAVYNGNFRNTFGGGTTAGAEAALINGLNSGHAYVNIHNRQFPGGELRADVTVTPEPASVLLVTLGLGCMAFVAGRRKASV